jgi:hypothetical protein
MIRFSVNKEDLVSALGNALKDIESNTNSNVSRVLLKLYIARGIDDDGGTYPHGVVFVSTIFLIDSNSGPEERFRNYNICVYKTNSDGQEFYDYLETGTFEETIFLSKETIEKMLDFLSKAPSRLEVVEILHNRYTNKTYIKYNDKNNEASILI